MCGSGRFRRSTAAPANDNVNEMPIQTVAMAAAPAAMEDVGDWGRRPVAPPTLNADVTARRVKNVPKMVGTTQTTLQRKAGDGGCFWWWMLLT